VNKLQELRERHGGSPDSVDSRRAFAGVAEARASLTPYKRGADASRAHRALADRIDGYDRDDLGESPDY